jgi:hypothetical protein
MSSRRGTALHSAAECNDLAAVRVELAKGVSTEVRNAGFEETPLHKAAVKGSVEAAGELLRAGADIAAVRSGGFTPLHMSETVEMAKLLLDHGADKTAKASVSQAPRSVFACYAVLVHVGRPVVQSVVRICADPVARRLQPVLYRTESSLVSMRLGAKR